MSDKSEYLRGSKFARKSLSQFRSYSKDSEGMIIAYKKTGSKQVIGKLSRYKSTDPFSKGYYDVLKKEVQTRKVKPRKKSSLGFGFRGNLGDWGL